MAQPTESFEPSKTLRVGVAGNEPFVFDDLNIGISTEIWDKIAQEKSWDYEYVPYETVDIALSALQNNEIDLAVGPISITAKRLESMRFSQPYYNSSISIISRIEKNTVWDKIKPLFSFKLILAVGVFLLILAIVGTMLWLAEHKHSPDQFSSKPLEGIGAGMWLAVVTMSTTGYGDKAPITLMGRIIAGTWMIVSIISATSMVAGIAATLSFSASHTTISTIEQLENKKAATIAGSSSEDFLKKSNVKVVNVMDIQEAVDKLENKEVDAIVFDRPLLLYYLKNHEKEHVSISKAEYYKQGYGFAFPVDSKLIFDINRELLELAESQEKQEVITTYILKDE